MSDYGGRKNLKVFTDKLLDRYHPGNDTSFVDVPTDVDAAEFREELRVGPLGGVLVPDGGSLSWQDPDVYERDGNARLYTPNLNMFVNTGDTRVVGNVIVTVWGRHMDYHPKSWERQIDLRFKHEDKETKEPVFEDVKMLAASYYTRPQLIRNLAARAYSDQGYDGHRQVWRQATPEQVKAFGAAVRRLLKITDL